MAEERAQTTHSAEGPQRISRLINWSLTFGTSMAVAAVLSACVGDAPAVDGSDPVLVQGREIYIKSCIGCHGADGGGGTGSKLNEGTVVATYPDIADQIQRVAEGKGQMPAFAGKLSDGEIEAVTRYTREGL